jgi:dipeptidyl-peptidase-3
MVILIGACKKAEEPAVTAAQEFQWEIDKFADLSIKRYQVPGFDELPLDQKKLIYYLSEAALCGRDIITDQNYKHNLTIRKTLDAIVEGYKGDRTDPQWEKFMVYVKRVWFSNGIHHHYATDKFDPGFTEDYFKTLIAETAGIDLDTIFYLIPIIFDPTVDAKKVSQDATKDLVTHSAVNFYEGVTQEEVEKYYESITVKDDPTPIWYGLNSRVVKKSGKVMEEVASIDGMYGPAIEKIVYWLEKASGVAENEQQKQVIDALIEYYQTGDLKKWDEYNILWVNDVDSRVDFVNGFIEQYSDPMGMKGSWESVINFMDMQATERTGIMAANAQWFEDNSPVDPRFKKKEVKGVTAKVITVAALGGDAYPSSMIGINLPNSNWIRKIHGSKSVTLGNIIYASNQASLGSGYGKEFSYSDEELERAKKYGSLASNIHTDLHEVLGHASGQLLPGFTHDILKNYFNPIEEARADLFALYYIMDNKMVELGLLPNLEAAKARYDSSLKNGLMTQLRRIELGKTVEQAHMRGRALVAYWAYEKGKPENVISKEIKDGKTYFVINDYQKLRRLYGELLAEVQRITSEGDYEAARNLVENYGVQIDHELHKEVLERFTKLNLAPYGGFINPIYTPVIENGEIVDIKIEYPDDYVKQMLRYGRDYSYL